MTRTCPECGADVEPDAKTCPNGHRLSPNAPDLSGTDVSFRLSDTSENTLRPTFTSDVDHLSTDAVIKTVEDVELKRSQPVDAIPDVQLPQTDAERSQPVEYATLAVFRLPEDPPLMPLAVQVGPGNVVDVVDAGQSDVIRWVRFSPEGDVVHVVSTPRGSDGLQAPAGIALDAEGRLYVADLSTGDIQRVETDGHISPVDLGIPLDGPMDVDLDRGGNLFIAESSACRVLKFAPGGELLLAYGTTEAPSEYDEYEEYDEYDEYDEYEDEAVPQEATPDLLADPSAVAVDVEGNIYIADTNHHRVLKLDADGTFIDFVAQGIELLFPSALQVSSVGELFVADLDGCRIHKFDTDGQHVFTIKFESGTIGGEFDVDEAGDLYIPDKNNQAVLKVRYTE